MRRVFWLSILTFCCFHSAANAQSKNCPISGNYTVGFDGCYHRTPGAVLSGCVARNSDCGHATGPQAPVAARNAAAYTLATPSQVTAALVCDIAAAAKKAGQAVDIGKALISANLTFSLVNKASTGVALAVGAIPIFAGGNIAPSLNLSSIQGTTTVSTTSIVVDPTHLQVCDHASPNDWLTSEVVTKSLPVGVSVAQITESVQYIVTKENSAGLKLNIIPITIGPQMSNEVDKAQQICLLFDFSKTLGSKPDAAKCSSAPGGGGSGSGSGSGN
jgi:hypothetical protein